MDDPDAMALRFLRARKWSVTAGVAMVRDYDFMVAVRD